jgi:mono/diheme cytochrome c family protein
MCHKLGTANTPRVPDNHAGLPSAICQTCHTTQIEIVGVTVDATVPIAEAPPIPHTLEGFTACTQCHEQGGPGVPQFPEDHQGRTDDLCSACHSVAVEEAEATPATDAVAATDEPASLAVGSPVDGQLVFSANCAACHGPDGEGSAIAPAALNDTSLLGARTDMDLATTILEGVTGRMPPSTNLSDRDIQDLVALMRSWQ